MAPLYDATPGSLHCASLTRLPCNYKTRFGLNGVVQSQPFDFNMGSFESLPKKNRQTGCSGSFTWAASRDQGSFGLSIFPIGVEKDKGCMIATAGLLLVEEVCLPIRLRLFNCSQRCWSQEHLLSLLQFCLLATGAPPLKASSQCQGLGAPEPWLPST